jgi:hypothetical protein
MATFTIVPVNTIVKAASMLAPVNRGRYASP